MPVRFSDEHDAFRSTVRSVVEREINPHVEENHIITAQSHEDRSTYHNSAMLVRKELDLGARRSKSTKYFVFEVVAFLLQGKFTLCSAAYCEWSAKLLEALLFDSWREYSNYEKYSEGQ